MNVESPSLKLQKFFNDLDFSGATDACFLAPDKNIVFGITGLPFYAPVCAGLLNDFDVNTFIYGRGGHILFCYPALKVYCEGEILKIPSKIAGKAKKIINRILSGPGNVNQNGEHIIDLKSTFVGTHYNVNLLLGDRTEYPYPLFTTPKSAVDAFGRGSFRSGGAQQVLATRYVQHPEENGEPANRQFYIVENGKKIFYSLNVHDNVKNAQCIHAQNHTEITYLTECGLQIRRTILILPQEEGLPEAVEAQRISIENLTRLSRDLKIVLTGVFGICSPQTIVNDVIYANVVHQSDVIFDGNNPVALTLHNKDSALTGEKKFATVLSGNEGFDDYCMSYTDFIGTGTLENPETLSFLPSKAYTKLASFFAMGKGFTLSAADMRDKNKIELISFAGVCEKRGGDVSEEFLVKLTNLLEIYRKPGSFEKVLNKVTDSWRKYAAYLKVKTGAAMFDSYVNQNLPFQVLYQTFVSRSFGWTQKAYRETGFREIQDIFASINYLVASQKAHVAKNLISMWAQNVFKMGYAYHDFTWEGKEPGDCSDDQLWLSQAVFGYVTQTGDYAFLNQELPVAGEDGGTRKLIDTLEAVLVYSGRISVGANGLPLLDKADWNDTLRLDKIVYKGPEKEQLYYKQLADKQQEYGVRFENNLTESVMNACLLKIAADQTAEMAAKIDSKKTEVLAQKISSEINDSVRNNCWKGDYYARCMINDNRAGGYTYLGAGGDGLSADKNINGTYYLNSFSWPILAGIADEEQISIMLEVVEKHLKCDAGLKLCTIVDYPRLGFVTATNLYYPGDRENGGVFKHAAMMAATAALRAAKTVKDNALAKRLADLAEFTFGKVLPYKTLENPYILKGNPRFCTQYNNSLTCENIGPILSGTSSWLTLGVYEMLGIKEKADTVEFNPVISGYPHFGYKLESSNGTQIAVEIRSISGNIRITSKAKFVLDGKEVKEAVVVKDGEEHIFRIEL